MTRWYATLFQTHAAEYSMLLIVSTHAFFLIFLCNVYQFFGTTFKRSSCKGLLFPQQPPEAQSLKPRTIHACNDFFHLRRDTLTQA